jgi:predicted PurR-regulated permease PerM
MAYLWFSLFFISLILNGMLVWYIRKLVKQFSSAIENIANFQEFIDEYQAHLDTLLQMERYEHEPTLDNLLKHTKDISNRIKEVGSPFSLQQEEE